MVQFIVEQNVVTGADVLKVITQDGSFVLSKQAVLVLAVELIDSFPGVAETLENVYDIKIDA